MKLITSEQIEVALSEAQAAALSGKEEQFKSVQILTKSLVAAQDALRHYETMPPLVAAALQDEMPACALLDFLTARWFWMNNIHPRRGFVEDDVFMEWLNEQPEYKYFVEMRKREAVEKELAK